MLQLITVAFWWWSHTAERSTSICGLSFPSLSLLFNCLPDSHTHHTVSSFHIGHTYATHYYNLLFPFWEWGNSFLRIEITALPASSSSYLPPPSYYQWHYKWLDKVHSRKTTAKLPQASQAWIYNGPYEDGLRHSRCHSGCAMASLPIDMSLLPTDLIAQAIWRTLWLGKLVSLTHNFLCPFHLNGPYGNFIIVTPPQNHSHLEPYTSFRY